MTASTFWEVGASGAIYDRVTVLDLLEERYAEPNYDPMAGLQVSDFACRPAGDGVWLVTYELAQGERRTRRLTVWRRRDDGWEILYHQGTVIG